MAANDRRNGRAWLCDWSRWWSEVHSEQYSAPRQLQHQWLMAFGRFFFLIFLLLLLLFFSSYLLLSFLSMAFLTSFFMSYYYWVVHPTTTTAVDSNDCILNNLHEQNRSSCADNQCCLAAAVFSAAEYNCHIVFQLTFLSFFCFSYLHFLCALPATSTSTLTSIGHSNANRCHSWVKNQTELLYFTARKHIFVCLSIDWLTDSKPKIKCTPKHSFFGFDLKVLCNQCSGCQVSGKLLLSLF